MIRLRHKLFALLFALLAWAPVEAMACPACFGAKDDPFTKSIGLGILFLLAVVGSVLGTIAGFFFYLARRAAALENSTPEAPDLAVTAGKI